MAVGLSWQKGVWHLPRSPGLESAPSPVGISEKNQQLQQIHLTHADINYFSNSAVNISPCHTPPTYMQRLTLTHLISAGPKHSLVLATVMTNIHND